MQKILHVADDRGIAEHDWLSSRFSFSFAEWYEPSRMGFGALRVLNDDTIAPHSGFPPHSHHDMEIITIVTSGAVKHTDSLGNNYSIPKGDVQVMSAGTGVTHSEVNEGDDPLTLFQLWIAPLAKGLPSRYEQGSFLGEEDQLLVSPDGRDGSLTIQQNAFISRLSVKEGLSNAYSLNSSDNCTYIFVVGGSIKILGEELHARDAMGIWEMDLIAFEGVEDAQVLFIEVPMR